MNLLIEVNPSETSLNLVQTDSRFINSRGKHFRVVEDIDPKGYWTFMPKWFFAIQLIPLVGIVAGSMAISAARKNKALILQSTSPESFEKSAKLEIYLTQIFGFLSILGIAFPAFLIISILALAFVVLSTAIVAMSALASRVYSANLKQYFVSNKETMCLISV